MTCPDCGTHIGKLVDRMIIAGNEITSPSAIKNHFLRQHREEKQCEPWNAAVAEYNKVETKIIAKEAASDSEVAELEKEGLGLGPM
jgi:hypothetical protein